MTGMTHMNGFNHHGNFNAQSVAKIDRVDFKLEVSEDVFQQYWIEFVEFFNEVAIASRLDPKYDYHCMGFNKNKSARIYIIESWGLFSDYVFNMLPKHYRSFVSRLDFKLYVDIDTDKFAAVARHVSINNKRGRNIKTERSRPREKNNQRDAGGVSFTVGSHGSDARLSIYKRGTERGAIEFQFKGKALGLIRKEAALVVQASDTFDWQQGMMIALEAGAHRFCQEIGYTLVEYLVKDVLDTGDNAGKEASRNFALNEVREYLDTADKYEKREVLEQLGIDLMDVIDILHAGEGE